MKKKCPKCGEQTLVKFSTTPGGKARWRCRGTRGERALCYQTTNPDAPYRDQGSRPRKVERDPQFKRTLKSHRYVITWAQNATPVHKGFFNALRAYCDHRGAELIVIPGRYKNPTSKWEASQENAQWWDVPTEPFLFNQRRALNKNVVLIGDVKIQPTMAHPLLGLDGFTHGESGIFGHPKLQLKCIPTPQSRMPKILTTTGACTVANYTDTRVGKLGDFHHVLGAAVVEVQDGKVFHLRQINYSERNRGFIDLRHAYFANGDIRTAAPYLGLVMGDAHARFADPVVVDATFGPMCDLLDPLELVWNDVLDGYAGSPHHIGNPFIAQAKRQSGFDDFRAEVDGAIDWIIKHGKGRKNVIVPSNHDNMLYRWVVREDWKRDPVNAEFYLETALKMLRTTRMTETGTSTLDPFQQYVMERGADNIYCIPVNGSYLIGDSEVGLHGDKGPNGARGSLKNLSRIGTKVIVGHSHTPGIEEGGYQTGTMTHLSAEYTGPVGSWLNTHCSVDAFNKRHLHNVINGQFTA